MSTRIHQLHYFAFALLLKASGLCHGQMTELNDERAMLAQSLSQGGRLAVFADHAGSPARVRELIREPRMQQGGEQHWERSDRSPLLRDPPLVSALQRAWKRGVVELAVEGYTKVLIECQKQQSPAATVALMRSDSQQAHCFRF
jgi:hypothetical protein